MNNTLQKTHIFIAILCILFATCQGSEKRVATHNAKLIIPAFGIYFVLKATSKKAPQLVKTGSTTPFTGSKANTTSTEDMALFLRNF